MTTALKKFAKLVAGDHSEDPQLLALISIIDEAVERGDTSVYLKGNWIFSAAFYDCGFALTKDKKGFFLSWHQPDKKTLLHCVNNPRWHRPNALYILCARGYPDPTCVQLKALVNAAWNEGNLSMHLQGDWKFPQHFIDCGFTVAVDSDGYTVSWDPPDITVYHG